MLEHTPRILLVDDEQSIQTLLSFPLRKDGYEVVQATDGREALARFGETTFDLVVLDVMLPRLDGLEVCRRMRARSSVPIIMLTAKAEEIDKVLGLELGADDYITKPFSLREFRSRVKAALRRAGMARRDPPPTSRPLEVHELRIDPAKRAVEVRGERSRRPSSSSRSSSRWPPARAACGRATCCSRASGATAPTATRARSTCTSATCARSSSATRRTRSTCSPCAASATASATRRH